MSDKIHKKLFVIFFYLVAVLWFIHQIKISKDSTEWGISYMKKINFSFSGIVSKKKEITGNDGVIFLTSLTPDTLYYDPRDSLDCYCCILKGNKGVLLAGGMDIIQTGDSIYFNGKENYLYLYRNKQLVQRVKVFITKFPPLCEELYKLTKDFQ